MWKVMKCVKSLLLNFSWPCVCLLSAACWLFGGHGPGDIKARAIFTVCWQEFACVATVNLKIILGEALSHGLMRSAREGWDIQYTLLLGSHCPLRILFGYNLFQERRITTVCLSLPSTLPVPPTLSLPSYKLLALDISYIYKVEPFWKGIYLLNFDLPWKSCLALGKPAFSSPLTFFLFIIAQWVTEESVCSPVGLELCILVLNLWFFCLWKSFSGDQINKCFIHRRQDKYKTWSFFFSKWILAIGVERWNRSCLSVLWDIPLLQFSSHRDI